MLEDLWCLFVHTVEALGWLYIVTSLVSMTLSQVKCLTTDP